MRAELVLGLGRSPSKGPRLSRCSIIPAMRPCCGCLSLEPAKEIRERKVSERILVFFFEVLRDCFGSIGLRKSWLMMQWFFNLLTELGNYFICEILQSRSRLHEWLNTYLSTGSSRLVLSLELIKNKTRLKLDITGRRKKYEMSMHEFFLTIFHILCNVCMC